jgi:urea transport system substrate-binding protein
MNVSRRRIAAFLGLGTAALLGARRFKTSSVPVKVGVLHSLTGTMALSERSVRDAALLAIDEVNEAGGVLDRTVEAVVADGQSDWPTFAREAERLIKREQVCTVFGCWTSASRKTVKPIFEEHDHLLIYPVQYEGIEQSPNIVYTGAAPNQQIIPAVAWSFENIGRRFFLVGSDYVFPRTAGAIIRDHVAAVGGEIAGEEYLLLGSTDVEALVQAIVKAKPDMILNSINGDTNIAFFRALRAAGVSPSSIPTMSFSIAEEELRVIGAAQLAGDYATWNYFQRLPSDRNRQFVERFRKRFGSERVTDDPIEAAYFGVHLWAQAVKEAGTTETPAIRRAMRRQSYAAPEGVVHVDPENQHTWKSVRVGRIGQDGQFSIVWSSEKPVRPVPYPVHRRRNEWEAFLDDLYQRWGQRWANPGTGR